MTSGDINERLEGAFLALIEEKPFAKITVNDIVEAAGVHRNTFYYHYQSIPAMFGEICRKNLKQAAVLCPEAVSPSDGILLLVDCSREHRDAVLNVYESEAKPIMMEYVRKICRYSIETYLDRATEHLAISRADRELVLRFFTAGFVGVWTEWIEEGMQKDYTDDFIRIGEILMKRTGEI